MGEFRRSGSAARGSGGGEDWRLGARWWRPGGRRTRTWTGCQRQEWQPCRAAAVRDGLWVTVGRVPDFVDEDVSHMDRVHGSTMAARAQSVSISLSFLIYLFMEIICLTALHLSIPYFPAETNRSLQREAPLLSPTPNMHEHISCFHRHVQSRFWLGEHLDRKQLLTSSVLFRCIVKS